jgi:hypothetical protein
MNPRITDSMLDVFFCFHEDGKSHSSMHAVVKVLNEDRFTVETIR